MTSTVINKIKPDLISFSDYKENLFVFHFLQDMVYKEFFNDHNINIYQHVYTHTYEYFIIVLLLFVFFINN